MSILAHPIILSFFFLLLPLLSTLVEKPALGSAMPLPRSMRPAMEDSSLKPLKAAAKRCSVSIAVVDDVQLRYLLVANICHQLPLKYRQALVYRPSPDYNQPCEMERLHSPITASVSFLFHLLEQPPSVFIWRTLLWFCGATF